MEFNSISTLPPYGEVVEVATSHENGWFIGTLPHLELATRVLYLARLATADIARLRQEDISVLARYVGYDPFTRGQLRFTDSTPILTSGNTYYLPDTVSEAAPYVPEMRTPSRAKRNISGLMGPHIGWR